MKKIKITITDGKIHLVILDEDSKEIGRNIVPEQLFKVFILEPELKSVDLVEEEISEEFLEKVKAIRFKLNQNCRTIKFSINENNFVVGFNFVPKIAA